ncbi:MAG: hypothetical protein AAB448_02930 [Patescibacteria group bacterium]
MSLREYLLILLTGTCAASIGWCVVLVSVNPFTAGMFGFFAFYLTLFFTVTGLGSTLGTLIRSRKVEAHDEAGVLRVLVRSLRQGTFLGLIVVAGCIALASKLFSPALFFCAFFVIGAVEFVLLLWEERHVERVLRRG